MYRNRQRSHVYGTHRQKTPTTASGYWTECIVISNPSKVFKNWTPEKEGVNGIYSAEYVLNHPDEFAPEDKETALEVIKTSGTTTSLGSDHKARVFTRPDARQLTELPGTLPSSFVFLDDLLKHSDDFPPSMYEYYLEFEEYPEQIPEIVLFIESNKAWTVFRR